MARAVGIGAILAVGIVVGAGGLAMANHVFSDVPDTHTHAPGIHWAAAQGVMQGRADGTFRPDAPVTRGQLATTLQRQGSYVGPLYTLTPACGTTRMTVVEHNDRGSGEASVEFSVNGGSRSPIAGAIPASGDPLEFDAGASGVVTLFVDGVAWASTPSGATCTP